MRDMKLVFYVQPYMPMYSGAFICPKLNITSVNKNRNTIGFISKINTI